MLTDAGANGICFCSVLIIAFHFTNHVCCHAIGLRVTTCPLFCRNFDVARRHSRKSTASTACDLRETMCARRFPRPTAWIRHAFPRKSSCLDPFVCHLCAVSHLDVVEANTCQCIMFVVAFLASDKRATSWHARTATSAKRFVSDSVSFGIIGVRFVQHRALPSLRLILFLSSTKSTPSSRGISSGTSRAAWPVWRSKMYIQPKQADGLWSRVDALDPCRGVALLSLSHRNGAPVVFQSITPCLLSNISIIKQAKPSLFGRDGSCCSWFNPNSHHAVMCISSEEITRVDVGANCICAIMRCKMESELKCNAFKPPPDSAL